MQAHKSNDELPLRLVEQVTRTALRQVIAPIQRRQACRQGLGSCRSWVIALVTFRLRQRYVRQL